MLHSEDPKEASVLHCLLRSLDVCMRPAGVAVVGSRQILSVATHVRTGLKRVSWCFATLGALGPGARDLPLGGISVTLCGGWGVIRVSLQVILDWTVWEMLIGQLERCEFCDWVDRWVPVGYFELGCVGKTYWILQWLWCEGLESGWMGVVWELSCFWLGVR